MQKTVKQKKPKFIFGAFFPIILILVGAFLIVRSAVGDFLNIQVFKAKSQPKTVQNVKVAKPYKLFIPKISKVLYISDGEYTDGQWVISKTGVSYLVQSAPVGSRGNTVIYGHNLPEILGRLTEVQSGDVVYVLMDDGQFFKYKIVETKAVTPQHVEILNNTTESELTIYTCTGFLDSARFVAVGKLVS